MSDKKYELPASEENSKWAKEWIETLTEMASPQWEEKAEAYTNKLASSIVGRELNSEERTYWFERTIAIGCIDKLLKMLALPMDMGEFLPEALKPMFMCHDYMVSMLTRMRNVAVNELKEKNLK